MEKGFKTLELLGDLDDKYIYEASRPWKKQHRFFHIQMQIINYIFCLLLSFLYILNIILKIIYYFLVFFTEICYKRSKKNYRKSDIPAFGPK